MPVFDFQCKSCKHEFEELTPYNESGVYTNVKCPACSSNKNKKIMSACRFNFSNPIGTDKWTSESTGHDYRFRYNLPKVIKQREMAERQSHMGSDPYNGKKINDIEKYDVGVHDAESRHGLS